MMNTKSNCLLRLVLMGLAISGLLAGAAPGHPFADDLIIYYTMDSADSVGGYQLNNAVGSASIGPAGDGKEYFLSSDGIDYATGLIGDALCIGNDGTGLDPDDPNSWEIRVPEAGDFIDIEPTAEQALAPFEDVTVSVWFNQIKKTNPLNHVGKWCDPLSAARTFVMGTHFYYRGQIRVSQNAEDPNLPDVLTISVGCMERPWLQCVLSGCQTYETDPIPIDVGVWHHVAYSFSEADPATGTVKCRIYFDGIEIADPNVTAFTDVRAHGNALTSLRGATVGAYHEPSGMEGHFFQIPDGMLIDEFAIIKGVLSAEQINEIYMSLIGPNLVVGASDITFVPDSPVEPGTIVVVSAKVHNVGTEDAGSFVVRFFNGNPDSGGIQIGGDREITSLAVGASEVISVSFSSSAEPQSYEIFVLVDAISQIEEADEANNKAFRILTAGPDLGLTSSDISFSAEVAGEVRITAEVHNVGVGDITENKIEVSFYNGDPDSGGIFIDDAKIDGGIPEGLSGIAEVEWSNPALGTYNIHVVADPEDEITEATKANNKAFNVLAATLDLTLTSEDICFNPEPAIISQEAEIFATVHNNGFLPSEDFVVKFYDGDPGAGGTELGTAEVVDEIAGLGSVQVSIPSTFTVAGKHDIYILADAANQVTETNEDNNIASKSLYVQYATIQETIDAAGPGDTVYIGPRTYNENVIIGKPITLIGAGAATTIIDGGGTSDVVLVTADNVTIKGFTVQNSIGDGSGIHLQASGASVSENIITQCYYGLFCDHSSSSYIAYNTVNANSYGIYCEYASGDAIRHNTITNNTLYGAKSYNSTLVNCFNWNYFRGNPIAYSYDPEEPVSPLLFANNVLQDNEIGIEVKDTSDPNLEFSENTIVDSDIGISCDNANPLIRDNTLSSNNRAIYLVNSSSPNIEGNAISNNTTGIVYDESSEPILTDNTMTGNVQNKNAIPVANAGIDQTVEADTLGGAWVTLDGSGSTDPDSTPGTNDDIVSFEWYKAEDLLGSGEVINYTFPLGTHTITLVVTDSFGETDDDEVIIVVQDTTPPAIHSASASPSVLWPPNHKMVEITVTVDAEDICDPAPVCKIVDVTSNEAINGIGDGNTDPDWQITGDLTLNLRAERAGVGTGRVYTIHVECTDASGNTTTATVKVTVPHDQRKGKK